MEFPGIVILLVEDNPGDARLIRELLKETLHANASLHHVRSLHEAAQWRSPDGTPHCVLVDLSLPDGDGLNSLSRMRELFPDSAVVVLTGMVNDELAIQALQKGAQSYMNKNELSARELGHMVRSSIERHEFVVRLREADRAMVLRERRFRALVERSNDLTLLVDRHGVVTYMSPVAARVLLDHEVEAELMHLALLADPDDEEAVRAYLDLSLDRPDQPLHLTLRARKRREDLEVWVEGTLTNLLELPGVNALVVNLHDITLRHQAEQELQRANAFLERRVEERTAELRKAEEDLRHALAAERELNDLKTRFVSTASHEFRTPLTAIKSSADLIRRYNGDTGHAKIDAHVERIRDKVLDLTAILDEFLSVEKLEKGLEHCEPEEFDLALWCTRAVEEMRLLAREGQKIKLELGEERMMVRLDRGMVSSVLRNLLSNAIKYSAEGAAIDLSCTWAGGQVRIEVADRGMGIPEEDWPHLFGRFFRAGNAATIQGTGLGLHIVQRYLELMQGSIAYTARPGGGSVFTVLLPRTFGI